MNTFDTGKLISRLRKEKGLTQSELADMLQISNRTVSKWENGDGFPDITLLPQICEILEITSDELLAGKQNSIEENEQQVIFEACSPTTFKNYKRLFDLHYKKSKSKMLAYSTSVCIIVITIIILYMDILPTVFWIFLAMFLIPLIAILIFYPHLLAKLHLKSISEKNNGQLCDEIIQVTDKMTLTCGTCVEQMELDQITGLYDLGDIFIIKFCKRHYAYINKDCFSIGSAEEFASFIRSKMTIPKENNLLKALHISGSILIISITIVAVLLSGIAKLVGTNNYTDYIDMDTAQLSALSDEELFEAVMSRVDEKYYEGIKLNECEQVFFDADYMLTEYENGGFCQYLYNTDNSNLDSLYKALDELEMNEMSDKIKAFIDDNDIKVYTFNSKEDYIALENKYPFKSFDRDMKNDFKLLKLKLQEYARQNINNL